MKHRLLGILAANLAAPYLTALFMALFDLLFSDAVWMKEPLDLLKSGVIGTFGLILFGLPLLLISAVLALALQGLSCSSRWHAMVSAGVLGFVFMTVVLISEGLHESWSYLVAGGCSGAICGWIYWRIAIRRTPDSGHDINAA